ncbi:MATE family efflux transporter, partial [Myxococcota bacterium]|nr:MATE family efflux transporter [Myxococcota bacterium]
ALSLSFLFIVVFVILGELTIDPLFRLMGARGEVLDMVRSYMRIWYAGLIFVVFPMVGNNAIRALGDTKTPGIIMMIAGLVNTAVDPLLIFGLGPFPRWGIAGAAVATVFARSITFAVAMYVLVRRERIVSFKRAPFAEVLTSWKQILFVGGPAAVTRIIFPVAVGIVTALLAVVGPHAVAGFGVAAKVEGFALLFTFAMSAVMAPFAGQNYGAQKIDRIRDAITFTSKVSMGIGLVLLAILFVLARPIASLFSRDPAVIEVSVLYFRVVPVVYGLIGVFGICSMVLNALNRPLEATGLSIFHMFVLYIPLAFLGRFLMGTLGIFIGIALSAAIAGPLSYLFVRRLLNRLSPPDPA